MVAAGWEPICERDCEDAAWLPKLPIFRLDWTAASSCGDVRCRVLRPLAERDRCRRCCCRSSDMFEVSAGGSPTVIRRHDIYAVISYEMQKNEQTIVTSMCSDKNDFVQQQVSSVNFT